MELIYNDIFLEHDTGDHPENSNRLRFFEGYEQSDIPSGEKYLELAHLPEYIDYVRESSEESLYLDPDTPTSRKSFEVACRAVGATMEAAKTGAFAIVRPPGHHACRESGMGFCLFNNMAIAALDLAEKGNKVYILDFDIHHGNGTEEILEGQKNILYASLHQAPLYPGTGLISKSNSVNVSLPFKTDDHRYIEMLNTAIKESIERFKPDIIGVSAGFDSYYKDFQFMNPSAGFTLTDKSFRKIMEIIGPYRNFFVLEGGYNPESIKEGVAFFSEPYRKWLDGMQERDQ